MHKSSKNRASSTRLSPAEWAMAIEQYELGYLHCSGLAGAFGISRQAMTKGLLKRGAKKASRVSEVSERLRQELDERDRQRWRVELAKRDDLEKWLSCLLAVMERNRVARV